MIKQECTYRGIPLFEKHLKQWHARHPKVVPVMMHEIRTYDEEKLGTIIKELGSSICYAEDADGKTLALCQDWAAALVIILDQKGTANGQAREEVPQGPDRRFQAG